MNGGNIEEGVPERQNVFKLSYYAARHMYVSIKVVLFIHIYGKSSAHLMTGIKATWPLSHHRNLVFGLFALIRLVLLPRRRRVYKVNI